ncbi:exodeoxyribonuclease III [Mesoterricola sediminis]|uniref:Exodeoxyribonuclease III n=1 Tax=Mesoterricola sediminis TaxID=2927980 RepID=A0AA48GYH4_9BACT|nr:exodeoxyribonuclease III [Mesoterricola sediminis]BDU76740.1 exodeoxyribonuclease III [Mesoterricola sediminis]
MKFFSWNVNGFRAVLKNGFMDWLEKADPDVLSLQEIRADWEQVDLGVRRELESAYDVAWFPSTSKKGYAGSATLSRKELGFTHTRGLGIEAYDQEGRMIVSTRGDLTFIAGYFPNASAGLARLPFKRRFAQDLAGILRERRARGERIILTGDMNVAPEEIDLARPKDNRANPGFTDEEREDFRLYLQAGMVDVLRQRNPGVPGLYTWWTARGGAREKNVGWRIDLFLVGEDLVPQVEDARILADVLGSDHCPISLRLA